jgi:predicted Fe-Mo cluster-binding NifX family protein
LAQKSWTAELEWNLVFKVWLLKLIINDLKRSTDMKIAIPTDGKNVAPHFGRCPDFTILEVKGDEIISRDVIENPGHQPGYIPEFLKGMGVDTIIAGGMGPRAIEMFGKNDIGYILGAEGDIEDVVRSYMKGELKSSKSPCVPGSGKGYGIDKSGCDHDDDR